MCVYHTIVHSHQIGTGPVGFIPYPWVSRCTVYVSVYMSVCVWGGGACMYVCVCMYVRVCMYVCMYVYYVYYVYMCVCMYTIYTCMYVCIYVCMYVCMYACVHVCIHVCCMCVTV